MSEAVSDTQSQTVGTMNVICPECGQHIPVVVTGMVTTDSEGQQFVSADADTTDLWAHYWTHNEKGMD